MEKQDNITREFNPNASSEVGDKVIVRFRSTGNAPVLKRNVFKISSGQKFQALIMFLRKELGYKNTDPLFLYINSSFAPAPDELIKNLAKCFLVENQLIINYATTAAWG